MIKNKQPIEEAVDFFGSQSGLAAAVDVSASFVSQLVRGDRPVPAKLAPVIEEATGGRVTRYKLRPDVFGDEPVTAA